MERGVGGLERVDTPPPKPSAGGQPRVWDRGSIVRWVWIYIWVATANGMVYTLHTHTLTQ